MRLMGFVLFFCVSAKLALAIGFHHSEGCEEYLSEVHANYARFIRPRLFSPFSWARAFLPEEVRNEVTERTKRIDWFRHQLDGLLAEETVGKENLDSAAARLVLKDYFVQTDGTRLNVNADALVHLRKVQMIAVILLRIRYNLFWRFIPDGKTWDVEISEVTHEQLNPHFAKVMKPLIDADPNEAFEKATELYRTYGRALLDLRHNSFSVSNAPKRIKELNRDILAFSEFLEKKDMRIRTLGYASFMKWVIEYQRHQSEFIKAVQPK